jgi:hypothetical protein
MNRIRIGCIISALLGVMYAAASLMSSLTHMAVGVIIAAVAVIVFGLTQWLEDDIHDRRIARERDDVWARRDAEARNG